MSPPVTFRLRLASVVLTALLATASSAAAQERPDAAPAGAVDRTPLESVRGAGLVLDSGTLQVGTERVALVGVDALPTSLDEGVAAAQLLADLVATDDVTCEVQGYDSQGTVLARCGAGDISDLGEALIRSGLARIRPDELEEARLSDRYEQALDDAQELDLGIWAHNDAGLPNQATSRLFPQPAADASARLASAQDTATLGPEARAAAERASDANETVAAEPPATPRPTVAAAPTPTPLPPAPSIQEPYPLPPPSQRVVQLASVPDTLPEPIQELLEDTAPAPDAPVPPPSTIEDFAAGSLVESGAADAPDSVRIADAAPAFSAPPGLEALPSPTAPVLLIVDQDSGTAEPLVIATPTSAAQPQPTQLAGLDDEATEESAAETAPSPTAAVTPAPTPTTAPTAVPTPAPTPEPAPTPTATPEPTPTATPDPIATVEPTPSPTPTEDAAVEPQPSATDIVVARVDPTPTATVEGSSSTATAAAAPTAEATADPDTAAAAAPTEPRASATVAELVVPHTAETPALTVTTGPITLAVPPTPDPNALPAPPSWWPESLGAVWRVLAGLVDLVERFQGLILGAMLLIAARRIARSLQREAELSAQLAEDRHQRDKEERTLGVLTALQAETNALVYELSSRADIARLAAHGLPDDITGALHTLRVRMPSIFDSWAEIGALGYRTASSVRVFASSMSGIDLRLSTLEFAAYSRATADELMREFGAVSDLFDQAAQDARTLKEQLQDVIGSTLRRSKAL